MPSTDRVAANYLLSQTKDNLKQQILQPTSALSAEGSRNKELHRQKLSGLKQTKDKLESPKERPVSTFKPLGNRKEASPVYPEGRKSANACEYKWLDNRHRAYASPTHKSRDKRASTSLGVSSPNSRCVNTIDSLQRELHPLRETRHELGQRLRRDEIQSGAEPEHDFILNQAFDLSDQNHYQSHRSVSSPIDCLSTATSTSCSRRIPGRQLSGDSESTFVIEDDFDEDKEDSANRQNEPPAVVENDHRVVKEGKYDRDMKESERHWQLQKKVSDLNSHSTQLEKRVTALKEENEILKNRLREQRSSEEKTKQLKRRNAELASIARHLEERLKQQQDSPKKPISISPGLENNASKQTSQKTAKSKERTRSFDDKDKVIETMRERFQELLRHNQSIQEDDLLNGEFYTEQAELESVIKVAAKERLQLEKQFVNEQHNPEIEAQLSKTAHLEQRNSELIDEVERLTIFAEEKEKLEVELMQRQIEVETLERRGLEVDKKFAELTGELQSLVMKNTQLTIENKDLKQQMGVLDETVKNFNSMSAALTKAEKESERARGESLAMWERVQTLEAEVQYLDEAEHKRRKLETEKHLLQETLQVKDQDLTALRQEREYDRLQHNRIVENLELRILEIEGKYKEQLRASRATGKDLRESGKKSTVEASRSCGDIQTDSDALSLGSGVSWSSCIDIDNFKIPGESISKTSINSLTANMNLSGQNSNVSCADLSPNDSNQTVDLKQNASPREHGYSTKCNGAEVSKIDGCFVNGDTVHYFGNGTSEVLQVFQAMFDYDPARCSPNDEPESELLLEAGDYMFVCGDMDEDGFYFAELLDGRQGLVPSNFIRKLSEKELLVFYSHINLDVQGTGQSVVPCEGEAGLFNVCNDHSDSFDIPDAPVDVQVESGPDHGCLMVSWLPVTITSASTSNGTRLAGYSIYVDDHKVKYLPNPTGDHILLEPEDFPPLAKPRLITVRTVGSNGRESGNSLPACIPRQLLHELNANNNCQEFAENEENLSSERLPLKSESFQKEIPVVAVSNTNPSNDHFQVKLQAEGSVIKSQFLEAQNADEKEIGRCSGETSRVRIKQNLSDPVSLAANAVKHVSRDDEDILYEAGRCYVWRKVYHKSKFNTEFVSSDLSATDLDIMQARAWKSLDAGDLKTASVKTRSQEILGVATKISDTIRCSSHTDVDSNRDSRRHWDINALSDDNECENVETVPSNVENSARKSGKRMHRVVGAQCVSASDASLPKKSAPLKSVSKAEHVDSAFSEFTASSADCFEGHREVVDDVSSYCELDDNNAVTSKKICDDLPDSELIDFSDDGGESLMENVECENDTPFRIFIALFSYDPSTMSPNPDAVMEELPFREGQIIKIYGEKDQDGFFLGEINHQRGLVPSNMISEVQFSDPEIAAQLLEDDHRPDSNSTESSCASSQTGDFTPRTHSTVSMMGMPDDDHLSLLDETNTGAISVRYVIALYDYDPQELSPNSDIDEELSFRKGDIVKVLGDVDDDGFYYGQLNDRFGLIPSNFVKEAPSSAIYSTLAMQKHYR